MSKKMHVQSVQNYCFSLSNMQICDVLLAVVVVVANAPYLTKDLRQKQQSLNSHHFLIFKWRFRYRCRLGCLSAPRGEAMSRETQYLLSLQGLPRMKFQKFLVLFVCFCWLDFFVKDHCHFGNFIFTRESILSFVTILLRSISICLITSSGQLGTHPYDHWSKKKTGSRYALF